MSKYIQTKQFCKAITIIVLLSISLSSFGQWYLQHPYLTTSTLRSVNFINEYEGWATGDGGIVLYTEDAGINWEIIYQNDSCDFKSIYFVNQLKGWVVGNKIGRIIFKTNDGGNTWEEVFHENWFSLYDIYFNSEDIGWAVGHEILHSTNGGNNWEVQYAASSYLISISFADPTTGWAAGVNGLIVFDFKQSWTLFS